MNDFLQISVGVTVSLIVTSQVWATAAMVILELRQAAMAKTPKWQVYLAAAFTPGPALLIGTIGAMVFFFRSAAPPPWSHWILNSFGATAIVYSALMVWVARRKPGSRAPHA